MQNCCSSVKLVENGSVDSKILLATSVRVHRARQVVLKARRSRSRRPTRTITQDDDDDDVCMYVCMYVAERAKLPFKCETCGERFSRQQDIARHKCSSSSRMTSSAVSQTK